MNTRARRCGFTVAQPTLRVARVLDRRARTSASEASATEPATSPVIGQYRSTLRPDVPATCFPPMKWP